MKTPSSVILSIAQPCHESWNEMTPADKGRFCQQCQKTVTDFSTLTDAQLIELLKNKQASACGRFTASQLNRVVNAPVPVKHSRPFISVAAVVAALTIAIPSVKAATSLSKVEQTMDKEDKPTRGNVVHEAPTGYISGVVKEDGDDLPIPGVTVRIKDTNIGTVTDQSGQFKLRIPDDAKKKVIILEVRYVGYEIKTVKVNLKKSLRPIKIHLTEDTMVLGKYGIHFNTNDKKDASLWEKFSVAVRNIFG